MKIKDKRTKRRLKIIKYPSDCNKEALHFKNIQTREFYLTKTQVFIPKKNPKKL
jgi:hypothetical protein